MTISSFANLSFPVPIAFGATGGPERRVEIVAMASGHERRNLRTAHALRHYDIGTGLRSTRDLETVLAFFEARRGPFQAFRLRDPFDHSTAPPGQPISALDVALGTGDGETTVFPLVKAYGTGADTYHRAISCAVGGSVHVAINGTSVSAWTLDTPGKAIRFTTAPAIGATVTAGFEFEVPVRFDTPQLSLSLKAFNAGDVPTIALKEVLL